MADDEQFSLCWNNFNTNLSAGFHESLCRGDLVDVTLAAEGQFVKAHRLVLSVCSPYFRKMFTQMPPNQHAFVFLKDVSHSALKDLIQFMYCGEVNVKQEALPAFISTAEALQIKGLTDGSDPPPAPSPTEPSAPTTQVQQISPRVRQRSTRAYKIDSVDDSGDDQKQTTQIVIQTTAATPQATIVTQQPQQMTQSQQPQSQQVASTGVMTTHHKRSARNTSGAPHVKRTKSTIDPLDTADQTTSTQQMTVQTAVVADIKTQSNEAEYIDLPIELPTKSEPDYNEEPGEVEAAEADAPYVEDDAYGDMRYDESYFTENEDGGNVSTVGGTSTPATTSKAVVKSFSDSSYADAADQSNNEAQDRTACSDVFKEFSLIRESELTFRIGQRGCTLLYFNGFNYVRNRRSGLKTYWICAKKGSTKCNARLVTDVVDGIHKIVLESCQHNHNQTVARKKRRLTTNGCDEVCAKINNSRTSTKQNIIASTDISLPIKCTLEDVIATDFLTLDSILDRK